MSKKCYILSYSPFSGHGQKHPNLTLFLAVGILSFILLIRHYLHGIVYSKTKETPVFNYIFGSALNLIILVIPLFIDQYQWLLKEMTSLIISI